MYFNGDKLYAFASQTPSQCMGFVLAGGGCVLGIDSCTDGEADIIESTVAALGGKVDCWFLTHAHYDHISGLAEILARGNIKIEKICYNFPSLTEIQRLERNDFERSYVSTLNLNERIESRGISVIKPRKGECIRVGHFTVLPLTDGDQEHKNVLNNTSVVYRVGTSGNSILFLGDTEQSCEDAILREFPREVVCPVVQASHHGQHGVSEEFYRRVNPKAVLWCTPDWLWNNDVGSGFNTGPFATVETRSWMEKLGAENFRPTTGVLVIE